jgi:uncharacterized protein with FMN-binding domain
MGAAAVMAVYAAGYVHTRSAAELLDRPMPPRRPMPPPGIEDALPALDVHPPQDGVNQAASTARPDAVGYGAGGGTGESSLAPASAAPSAPDTTEAASRLDPEPPGARASTVTPAVATAVSTTLAAGPPATSTPVSARPSTSSTSAGQPGTSSDSGGDRASSAPGSSPAVPPAAVVASAAAAVVEVGGSQPDALSADAATASSAPATSPVAPAAPKYTDGTYTGWGTSRHGDIEATVVIENGRIASAAISKCWTRYPCTWIVKLPPQVAARQSPETDYVSGATQSTNAFYYGVVEALGKASAK